MRCNEYQYKHRILRYSNSTFVSCKPIKDLFFLRRYLMQDASQVPADLAADDAPVQALRRAPVQGPLFVEFVKGAKTPVVGTLPDVDQVEVFQRRPMSCPDGSVPWWSWCEVEKSRMKIGLRRELRGDGRMYVETRSTTGWTRLDSVGLGWTCLTRFTCAETTRTYKAFALSRCQNHFVLARQWNYSSRVPTEAWMEGGMPKSVCAT